MKKITIGIITFLLCFSNSVLSKEWSDKEKNLYTAYGVLTVIDTLQTRSALRDPCECYSEGNPLLGSKYPSDAELVLWGAASMWAYHTLIERDAPDWMLYTALGLRGAVVISNHEVGVRIKIDL